MPDELNLNTAWLEQLQADLDDVEKDTQILSRFSGSRSEYQRMADSIREQQRSAERLLQRLDAASSAASSDKIKEQRQRAKTLQRQFRAALLQYRSNTRASAQKERELLLSGATTPAELRQKKARSGNATLNAAADVTTALQETVSMMNSEIEKSAANITAMQESSNRLRKTKDQYVIMDDVLKLSKSLIKTLEQADAVDRWLMLGGLVLFSLVAFNILRKRVWIPGLYTVFYIIRYIFTLGFAPGRSSAAESPHIDSDTVTQQIIYATTTTSIAAIVSQVAESMSGSDTFTTTLEPSLPSLTRVVSLSSTLTLETFATTTGMVHKNPKADRSSKANEDTASGDTSRKQKPDDAQPPSREQPEKPKQKLPPGINMNDRNRKYRLPVERPRKEEL
ncbi:Vesicle transport protein S20 [Coemansia brasiliensis]|uniref:Vesicle transport protein S20 n=1 Tax=Coemansia brasiliensis TaxID=2650707 RepID=A0A9W8IF25_9FUNG|nr:Vesicle transport protein S20 [Coemansia brasiliensis]